MSTCQQQTKGSSCVRARARTRVRGKSLTFWHIHLVFPIIKAFLICQLICQHMSIFDFRWHIVSNILPCLCWLSVFWVTFGCSASTFPVCVTPYRSKPSWHIPKRLGFTSVLGRYEPCGRTVSTYRDGLRSAPTRYGGAGARVYDYARFVYFMRNLYIRWCAP